ncbi:hypothetical protein ACFQX6_42170 [Streptosporangium lutulentum]
MKKPIDRRCRWVKTVIRRSCITQAASLPVTLTRAAEASPVSPTEAR